jgi:hypothetical protein
VQLAKTDFLQLLDQHLLPCVMPQLNLLNSIAVKVIFESV